MEYHRDDVKDGGPVMVGKGNVDEKPIKTKVEELLSGPTALLAFEDADVGFSFEVDHWLYWLNILGEFK